MDERGRSRTAVQIFIRAADREIDVRGGDVHRHGTGGMRQIPDHDRTDRMRARDDRGHVVAAAGAVIDLGQQHDRDGLVDRVHHRVGRDDAQVVAAIQRGDQPLRHV